MVKKSGTKEWSDRSLNIQRGCENFCRYCFARYNAVVRFKQCEAKHWPLPCIDNKKVDKNYRTHYEGVTMFPTTHDITPANLSQCLCVLRKQLDLGNKMLIVSKPRWDCIPAICEAFREYQDLIEFRLTIGSTDSDTLRFWEPGAPNFSERLSCLKYAYHTGYKTSISCEPYIDPHPGYTYQKCKEWITESFWIGKMNRFKSRVNLDDATPEQMTLYVDPLLRAMTDSAVKVIFGILDGQPLIKWKESVRDVMEKVRVKKCE